jgi:hypothetical protein
MNFVLAYRDPADKFTTAKIGIEALDGGIDGSADVEKGSPENAEKV